VKCWILDETKKPVEVDLLTWARWYEDFDQRRVAETETACFRVSTVFLGIDHRGWRDGPPILFETMVFERKAQIKKIFGKLMPIHQDVDQRRYSSWDDAESGHNAAVRRILKAEADAAGKIRRRAPAARR